MPIELKKIDREVISGDSGQIILLLTKFRFCHVCACILSCWHVPGMISE